MMALPEEITQDDAAAIVAHRLVPRALIKFEESTSLPLARLLEPQADLERDRREVLLEQLRCEAYQLRGDQVFSRGFTSLDSKSAARDTVNFVTVGHPSRYHAPLFPKEPYFH